MRNIHINPHYTSAYNSNEYSDSPDLFTINMDEDAQFAQGEKGSVEWFLSIFGVGQPRLEEHYNFILLCNNCYAGFSAKSSFSVELRETLRY